LKMLVGTHAVNRLVDTFARGKAGEAVAYFGSSGYLEIAINKGNASRTLSIGRGAPVILSEK
jgi:S-adenosylmethionine hydrolase